MVGRAERLAQVVVRAASQTADAVLQPAAGGEHDNRDSTMCPSGAEHVEAIDVRQSKVQDQQGDAAGGQQPDCFRAGTGGMQGGRPF
jgi:hypothetical protein